MQYESVTDKRGRKMYYTYDENGHRKLVSLKNIPEGAEIRNLDPVPPKQEWDGPMYPPEIPDAPQGPQAPTPDELDEKPGRVCLFGDGPGVMRRMVNGELRYLCEDHYQTKTLGELVQYLRESSVQGV